MFFSNLDNVLSWQLSRVESNSVILVWFHLFFLILWWFRWWVLLQCMKNGLNFVLIGSLSNDDGSEDVTHRDASNSIAYIWALSICQMLTIVSGVELQRTVSKFIKRKRKPSSVLHVLHKTWNWDVLRRSRAVTAKKDTRQKAWCTCKVVVLPFSLLPPIPSLPNPRVFLSKWGNA